MHSQYIGFRRDNTGSKPTLQVEVLSSLWYRVVRLTMHYELVSRALAYVSCISTMSLLMTSMAIAAINDGRTSLSSCMPNAFVTGIGVSNEGQFGGLSNPAQVNALA